MHTSDLALITALRLRGNHWQSIRIVRGNKVEATFEDSPQIHRLRDDFYADTLLVPARAMMSLYRDVKRLAEDSTPELMDRQTPTHGAKSPWQVPTGT